MNRRRGSLALALLLAFSGLAAAAAILTRTAADSARNAERYRQGLAAQYAAESGALWGLSSIRTEGLSDERSLTFSISADTETTVRLVRSGGDESAWTGTVYARGEERGAGLLRYTVLSIEVTEGETRTVTVKEVSNARWN